MVIGPGRTDYTPQPTRHFLYLRAFDRNGAPAPSGRDGYISQISVGLPASHGGRRVVATTQSAAYRISAIPAEFAVEAYEIWGDVPTNNFYIVGHEPQRGVARDLELTTQRSGLWPIPIEFREPRSAIRIEAYSKPKDQSRGDLNEFLRWTTAPATDMWRGTLWTSRQDGIATFGIFDLETVAPTAAYRESAPGLFYNGGATVVASQYPPHPSDPRLAENEPVILGTPPYWIRLEASGAAPQLSVSAGLYGSLRDALNNSETRVVVRDENGVDIAFYNTAFPGIQTVPVSNRYTIVASTFTRSVAGVLTRSEATATLVANSDTSAPSLSMMRFVDPRGKIVPMVRGSGSALEFRAGDNRELVHAQTRVFWRRNGTADWVPLPVSRDATTGIYRADLSTVKAGLIDLRIELADVAGNTATWTGTPALLVEAPARGRADRK